MNNFDELGSDLNEKEYEDCGRYQVQILCLICIGSALQSSAHTVFVFSAMNLEQRCKVPECDDSIAPEFNSTWLSNAVPFDGNNPKNCERFQYINLTAYDGGDECPAEQFDQNVIEGCSEYVYKTKERTILIDFDLHCDENLWKLTLVGTINTVGQFVGLPISGVLSDRFGRRTLLIIGMVGCGIFGVIRAFVHDYILFLVFEFLDALFLSGTYACCFILATLEKLTKPVEEEPSEPFFHVFKSKILLLRFINACFCWITCAFLFYGLTLNSVALAGNSYLDFILTALVEIPAYALTYVVVDRIGRRWSQSGSYFITAIACFVFIFIQEEQSTLRLCFYLLGKFGATAAFTIIYVISSEIFPTPLRHSLMGACSMFGRIGSMVSPQMPLLSALWTPLPLVLFSGMAAVAGLLTLLFPETVNTKLPDTIEEAVNIGRKRKESSHL
ncbi:solute carrier family 22 member [Holotrichia oblita]|uniref:Solute carrier family 22 member n=1 Tax=Holotrichia oblita TaxID=644536 RepID=A0ACB9SVX6_HOLOL|nr:solute carrier family 22 member [Holotrichia oblita]